MPTILTFEVQMTSNVFMKARVMTENTDPGATQDLAMRLAKGFSEIAKALEPAAMMRPFEEYASRTGQQAAAFKEG